MGHIGRSFEKLDGWAKSFAIEVFASVLKPAWIKEALRACGRETKRERKLPAGFTVWLVVAMGFYRNLSIKNILHRLGCILGVGSAWEDAQEPASASAVEARDRVGFGPLRVLVERFRHWLLETYREAMSWKGMLLLALDGSTFKVPDSDENRRRFGLPGASRGRAAFPQMRALFLVSARLRFILGALFAPYDRAEVHLALRMLPLIPQGALVLLDRNFNTWLFLLGLQNAGHHFLIRAKKGMDGVTRQLLGPGDRLIEVTIPRALRRQHRSLPKTVVVREISIRIRGTLFRFWTTLLDPTQHTAIELAGLYAERWEEEIGLDEIKTHQCGATTVNRPVIFRCQTSRRVLQEAYGLVLAYNLVRTLMTQAAFKHAIPPLKISFVDSLERIRAAAVLMAAAPTWALPAMYQDLLEMISHCVLPRRRRRDNPRVVCIKMSKFQLKKKGA